MTEDAPQRTHSLREVFNGLRWLVRAGSPWRMIPNDLPPWEVVYQKAQRWLRADVFESPVHDLGESLRVVAGRNARPSAAVLDSWALQSSAESGARAAYGGAKHRKGSKTHIAVDMLGHLLALVVTSADEQARAQVARLAERVREVMGESVELAFVDQSYTGGAGAESAAAHGLRLEVVKLPEAKRGFALLPRRWVVERSFVWARSAAWRETMNTCRRHSPGCIS
jgi:transposase